MLFTSLGCSVKLQAVRGCPTARMILQQVLFHNLPSCRGAAAARIGRRASTNARFMLENLVFLSCSLSFLPEVRKCSSEGGWRQDIWIALLESRVVNRHRFSAGICIQIIITMTSLSSWEILGLDHQPPALRPPASHQCILRKNQGCSLLPYYKSS